MARLNEITSTEKLLKVIRGKKERAPAPSGAPEPPAPKTGLRLPKLPSFSLPLKAIIPIKKSFTVGIDIGHEYLHLVRAAESSNRKWQIIDRRRLPLPPRTPRSAPEFSAFLKESLASFCGSANESEIWAIMSAARVEVRHIRIPKVPKKQIDNAVYWTAKKDSPFDEKEMIFDFDVQGEVVEQGISKLAVMVYTAPRQEIEDLKSLFSRIGWPLTGISIVPFAMQNLFKSGWIPSLEGSVASLFIGNDFSRIDIYNGGNLVMTRGIKAGTSSMAEALLEQFNELRQDPEAPALTMEQGRKIIQSLSPDSPPLEENDPGFGIRQDEIFEMIRPALERLVRQVERTFEHYATTGGSDRITKIFVSGVMNVYKLLVEYVGNQLGIDRAVLDFLSERDNKPSPHGEDVQSMSERIAFAPALGLAMSDNAHTPNLMFTYKDKEKAASITRINRVIFAVFITSVLICTGIFTYQNIAISQKKAGIAGLDTQIASLGPAVNQEQIMKMMAKATQQKQLFRDLSNRYLGMVIIGELATLTPANIRLIDLKIGLGPATSGGGAKQPSEQGAAKALGEEAIVEGLIIGDRQMLETTLAGYAALLEKSPIFEKVTVQKSTIEPFLKSDALHFILNLKVEEQVHG